jgi:hypothetical protein
MKEFVLVEASQLDKSIDTMNEEFIEILCAEFEKQIDNQADTMNNVIDKLEVDI